jgi:hypothetical protein
VVVTGRFGELLRTGFETSDGSPRFAGTARQLSLVLLTYLVGVVAGLLLAVLL